MSDLDAIKEIEKIIGEELKPCPPDADIMSYEQGGCYLLNEQKQVIGLNLWCKGISEINILKYLSNLTLLCLGNNKISDISVLKTLPNLTQLHLWTNKISDISVLKTLPNLTDLYLGSNKISDISVLKALPNLTVLSLWSNQISNISILKTLPNLTELNLGYNPLSDISVLQALPNLTQLDLSDNKLSDISVLQALPNLTRLDLSENRLDDISVLKVLPNLTHLNLSFNKISDINVLQALPNLTQLNLSSNQISDISILKKLLNLTFLDLRNNQLKVLPEWLLNLNIPAIWKYDYEDTGIYLEDNPLEEPPPEIIELGNDAIRSYFNAGERKAINEVKIILIGDGGAGKTSLSKALRGELFDKHENQTHGINIYKQALNGITVNFWDFGGQEMMHATHQFFLSKRSLYLLVLDSREEDKAEYWLKYIESFGGNSPILVVLNKIDQHPSFEVNNKFLQAKYQGIQGFYKISCANQQGLDELKEKLCETFAKVPLIRSKLPKTWFAVKNQLENLPPPKNFIDYQAFRDLCADQQITDSATQDVLSQYLNDLGVIIHFTDPQLMGTPVLKPRWITQAVYKIINFKPVAEAHGVFNLSDLSIALAKKTDEDFDYPPEKYNHIIELMKKFEICYELENKQILIPDLLEIQEPDFEFDDKDALRFRIRYDFLSRLIMPRFIVKRHLDIKDKLRWRTGVVLEDKNLQATAVVKVDYQDRLIDIVVNGNQKRDYFAVIRKTFDEIHAGFDREKFEVVEWVLLPDEPSYQGIKYKELIGYEKARRDEIFVGELGKAYSVSTLLNGIEKPEDRRKEGDNYFIHGDLVHGDKSMGDKIKIRDISGDVNGVIGCGTQTQNKPAESKEESLFKKPLFYIGVGAFIYFCLVLFSAYDLQQQGLLGNKTFKEIVLAPIPLLKTDDKK